MTKSFKKRMMIGNGCGFSKTKQKSTDCSLSSTNNIITTNKGSTPKLKSSLKSNSYTRKNIPVSFSPNTKSSSNSITPKKQKKKKYTSMKKRIQIDKANAKLNFKTKSQQLQEDIRQLRDEKLKMTST